jgi:hypothetical protein
VKTFLDPLYVEDEFPVRDDTARSCRAQSVTGYTRSMLVNAPSVESYRSYLLIYGSGGVRELQERFSADGRVVDKWFYDNDGRVLEEVVYSESGDLDYRFEFAYEGRFWKEKRMLDALGTTKYRIVGDRTADGSLSEATFYGASGEAIRSDRYCYNSLGQLIRVDVGLAGRCEWEYDEAHNLAKRSKNLPGASVFGDIDEFEYDDRGLIRKKTHLNRDETFFTWAFVA